MRASPRKVTEKATMFQLRQVAMAADVPVETLKTYIGRELLTGFEGGGGPGQRREFSFNTVMECCTAIAAIKCGAAQAEAFSAAMLFAHAGKGPTYWVGESPDTTRTRMFSAPFDRSLGRTLLALADGNAALFLVADGKDVWETVKSKFPDAKAALIIDLNIVFDRTCEKLDLDPKEVFPSSKEAMAKYV